MSAENKFLAFLEKEFFQGDLVWLEWREEPGATSFYQVEVVGTYGEFPFEQYVVQWLDKKPKDAGTWETKVVSKAILERRLHKSVKDAT